MNQSKVKYLHVAGAMRGKTCAGKSRLVLVLLLIGQKIGPRSFSQSCSIVIQNQLLLETQSKTALSQACSVIFCKINDFSTFMFLHFISCWCAMMTFVWSVVFAWIWVKSERQRSCQEDLNLILLSLYKVCCSTQSWKRTIFSDISNNKNKKIVLSVLGFKILFLRMKE